MQLHEEVNSVLLELIVGLNSARRIVRAYPEEHPVVRQIVARVMATCDSILQVRNDLAVGVTREALMVDGRYLDFNTVYSEFAAALFDRGVGGVILQSGLEVWDLATFISVLNMDREEILKRGGIGPVWSESGSTSIILIPIQYELFKAAEVPEVTEAVDALQVNVLWEDFLKALTSGPVKLAGTESSSILSSRSIRHVVSSGHPSTGTLLTAETSLEACEVQPGCPGASGVQQPGGIAPPVLDHDAAIGWEELVFQNDLNLMEHGGTGLHDDMEPDAVDGAIEKILLFLLDHGDGEDDNGIEEAIASAFRLHLEGGQYERAACIIQEALAERISLQPRQRLSAAFTSEENIDELISGLRVWGKRAYGLAQTIIASLGATCLPRLLHHLGEEEDMQLRKFIIDRIIEFGPRAKDDVICGLRDGRWYFVRNLLVILRGMNDSTTVMSIRPLLRHRTRIVRQEALRSLLHLKDPQASEILIRDLCDTDQQTRFSALKFCSDSWLAQPVLDQLAKLALKPGFTRKVYQEREAAVAALAQSGKQQTLAVLSEILKSRNVLAPRRHMKLKNFCLLVLEKNFLPSLVAPLAAEFSQERGELGATASAVLDRVEKRPA